MVLEGGNCDIQFILGTCYLNLNGVGITKDEEKTFLWFLRSAERGNDMDSSFVITMELEPQKMKKKQFRAEMDLKSQQFKHRKDISLTLKSSVLFKFLVGDLESVNNYNCCICWQANSCIKNCKNYFRDFGRCHNCGSLNIGKNMKNADEWEIWRWIDYSNLKDIEYLDKGAFGTVRKAEWKDMPEELFEFYNFNQVSLKKLKNSKETLLKLCGNH
ncbi:hypothetical protein Glove_557g2 [Diversispora epigaea]|uniref:Protein kinase domain-containing protein n=1 Tax=Diversispora epigaea TaxID=1348612 RepID=A0A397GAY8_9GLOM|nr:hypothetical protein Glove_557g2 [Diversispora epigaea]